MKVGVIGTGEWGRNHVRVYSEIVGPDSVTVSDLYDQNLRIMKERYNVGTTTRYKELLNDSDIEGISICTTSSTHFNLCKESLLSGKDVLCEKPLALDSTSCKELVDIAEREDRVLMVGHIFRYDPLLLKSKELVESGLLGKIFFLQSERLGLRTPRSDCGVVFDFAIHDVDMACHLAGHEYPEEVSCVADSYLSHTLDDFGIVNLRFPDGINAHIVVSWLTPQKVRSLTIVGKERSVFADFVASKIQIHDIGVVPGYDSFNQFRLIKKEGATSQVPITISEPLKVEIEHFLECVRSGKRPVTDGLVGLRAVQIVEAAYRSAATHQTVKMNHETCAGGV